MAQLTPATGYNTNKMVFSKPEKNSIPNTPMQYKRVRIATKHFNGTEGDLIFPTEKLFSFGVCENRDQASDKLNGYTFPLCMWSRNEPTEAEKNWTDTFNNVVEKVKDYIIDNKDELELYDVERTDLRRLNPLYWKREGGKIVEGKGPTLYVKLLVSKKKDFKIMSKFYDINTEEDLDPLNLVKKYCDAESAIKIESIFIGARITLQVKLLEANVNIRDGATSRLLSLKPKPQGIVSTPEKTTSNLLNDGNDSLEESSSSSSSEDEEEEKVKKENPKPKEEEKPKKKVIRKKK